MSGGVRSCEAGDVRAGGCAIGAGAEAVAWFVRAWAMFSSKSDNSDVMVLSGESMVAGPRDRRPYRCSTELDVVKKKVKGALC